MRFQIHIDSFLGGAGEKSDSAINELRLIRKTESRARNIKSHLAELRLQMVVSQNHLTGLQSNWDKRVERLENKTGAKIAYTFESL